MRKSIIFLIASIFIFSVFFSSAVLAGGYGYKTEKSHVKMISEERAEKFIGTSVINHLGQDLGTIKKIIFDQDGYASYLLLARADREGLIGVPLEKAEIVEREDQEMLSVNFDKESIMNAPAFSSANDFKEPTSRVKVRAYFNVE